MRGVDWLSTFIGLAFLLTQLSFVGCGEPDSRRPEQRTEPPSNTESKLTDPTGFFSKDQLLELEEFGPLGDVPESPTNRVAKNDEAARLGQFLFFEEGLSGNGEVSCATCHQPDYGFADPRKLSVGFSKTNRHAPTLLNVAYNKWYFWDGRADTLWAQVHTPLEAPNEHRVSRVEVAHFIDNSPEIEKAYKSIFGKLPELQNTDKFPDRGRPVPDNPDHPEHQKWRAMSDEARYAVNEVMANVGKAIAAYERKLVSKNAPFDRFMRGLRAGDESKIQALSDPAKRGLELFIGKADCNECHTGPFLSDRSFHNLGLPRRAWLETKDPGRYEGISTLKNDLFNAVGRFSDAPDSTAAKETEFVAQKPMNRGQFKTPTLRNVEKTAPYMHGGHFETLEEVVEFYADLEPQPQLGHREESLETFELTESEKDDLIAFLKSLSGRPIPGKLSRQPKSPHD
jgi:cytochrome c peroxidase